MFFDEVVFVTVNKLADNRVLITLCNKDMTDFSLDFNSMSFNDNHSRRVILRIMQAACRRYGINVSGKRLNVEAMLFGDDCYLLVTVSKKQSPHTYRLKSGFAVCYAVENAEALLALVKALYRKSVLSPKNAVFELNGKYYIIFEHYLPLTLRRVLSEYAKKKGGIVSAAQIREYGNPVCTRDAVAQIGKCL